ncbi:MAG: hypothetical protein IPK26_31390 [Planctomycetes bacterium]|nr:hypothetical protein [Planctomycetota bacterium]
MKFGLSKQNNTLRSSAIDTDNSLAILGRPHLSFPPLPKSLFKVLAAATLLATVPAQDPLRTNAGFGGTYLDFQLDPQTGATAHLGVAVDSRNGHIFVSATRGAPGLPHRIWEFDARGNLIGSFAQPTVHSATAFGIRDLEFDGQNLIGGSEAGISVFSVTGALVGSVEATNGPQPVQQPIAAAGVPGLWVPRAIALDPNGNNRNGSLLVADFDASIVEIDLAGQVLTSWQSQGWVIYGMALDPVSGNVWINSFGGDLAELDRASMTPTGRTVPQVVPNGVPGGLSMASPQAGHHQTWPVAASLVQLTQDAVDRVGVHRLHLHPGLQGPEEPQLRLAIGGGLPTLGNAAFAAGDTLTLELFDPTGLRNGQPCWSLLNFHAEAVRDGVTDLSPVLPGAGVVPELWALNALSVPPSTTFAIAPHVIGTALSVPVPSGFSVALGDVLRWQSLWLLPGSPALFAASNEAHFVGTEREHGIVVRAEGANSFRQGPGTPFWAVSSDGTHAHGDILRVEFSFLGATGPAAPQHFDIDQDNMGDRFDGGNATGTGCRGTYRNGSDALCGLDYGVAGVHVVPGCHTAAGESSGVVLPVPPTQDGSAPELAFHFTNFGPGKSFEFDCDTDGGVPSGDQHAGMIVRVVTQNSGVLTGVLAIDPNAPDRAVVWFP